jgi:hypothetical protein
MVHVPQMVAVHAVVLLGFIEVIVMSVMPATSVIQPAHVPSLLKRKKKKKKERCLNFFICSLFSSLFYIY